MQEEMDLMPSLKRLEGAGKKPLRCEMKTIETRADCHHAKTEAYSEKSYYALTETFRLSRSLLPTPGT